MNMNTQRDCLLCVSACVDLDFASCHGLQQIIHLKMSQEEYLNRLLKAPENRVQGECAICFDTYNTMNTSTGIIEAGVRLSCGHTVGSACIVTWLRHKSNCPLCRETFFPRKPRPYLEHGIMDLATTSTVRIHTEPGMPPGLSNRGLDAGRSSTVRAPAGDSDVGRSRAATVYVRPSRQQSFFLAG